MKYIQKILIPIILTSFAFSSESVPTQEEVSKLYVATFNRAPDSEGLSYWTNISGLKLSEIASSFFDQTETKALYPEGTSNRNFISSVYQNLFNRTPDIAGWDYWETELNTGAYSKNLFIQTVINGAQNTETSNDATILNNKNEVGLHFANEGLTNTTEAKNVMNNVTDSSDSVINAKATTVTTVSSNEPYYKYQWHIKSANSALKEEYDIEIDENADISILEAWTMTKGAGVKVAVIDDSFDVEHEDLKSNIVATYSADDDSSNVSNSKALGETGANGERDDGSHGNTCAGFIVAPVNKKGIIGIAPESNLVAIKLQSGSDIDTIKAFEYARSQGAKVISCSWGTENVSEAVSEKLKSLYDENITVLFASGNDGKDLDAEGINDESEVEWVLGIGASGENNDVTVYSNYGKNIEVLAPGGDTDLLGILGIDDTGERGSQNQQGIVDNNYAFSDGTSFATPVAAGVVALMYSINPGITPAQVKNILINNTDKIGTTASYNTSGFDQKRAYGKINAKKAVSEAKKLLQ